MQLGNKYNCFQCQTKFYDLGRPVPVCPRCGADQRLAPGSGYTPAAEKRGAPTEEPATAQRADELGTPLGLDDAFLEDADTAFDEEAVVATSDTAGTDDDDEDSFD